MLELSPTISAVTRCVKGLLKKRLFALVYILDYLKTHQMCVNVVFEHTVMLQFTPLEYNTQEKFENDVNDNLFMLELTPVWHKIREMCEEAVNIDPSSSKYVPDLFVTPKMLLIIDNADLDNFINRHNRFKQHKDI